MSTCNWAFISVIHVPTQRVFVDSTIIWNPTCFYMFETSKFNSSGFITWHSSTLNPINTPCALVADPTRPVELCARWYLQRVRLGFSDIVLRTALGVMPSPNKYNQIHKHSNKKIIYIRRNMKQPESVPEPTSWFELVRAFHGTTKYLCDLTCKNGESASSRFSQGTCAQNLGVSENSPIKF